MHITAAYLYRESLAVLLLGSLSAVGTGGGGCATSHLESSASRHVFLQPVTKSDLLEDWHENTKHVDLYWNEALSPEDYLRALELTVQNQDGARGFEGDIALGPWVPLGPGGNYENAYYNGRMAGIEIRQVGSLKYIYTGATGGGLWSGTTAAPVWSSIGDGLPNPSVRAFAVHPNDFQTVIACTGDWRRYTGAGIYRTTNSGAIWLKSSAPITPDAFFRVRYLPSDPNIVIAACGSRWSDARGGILRSTDAGATWDFAQMNDGLELTGRATDLRFHPTTPELQFALVRSGPDGTGLYRSFDGGASWHYLAGIGLPTETWFDRASMAICRDFPQNMAIVAEKGNVLEGVYVSGNVGLNWTDKTGSLRSTTPCDKTCFGNNQIYHAQAIAFRPNDPHEIYVGAVKLARTTDGGTNWEVGASEHDIEIGHPDITQLYFSDVTGDDVLWILNDGGLYRSDLIASETTSWNGDGATGLHCAQIDHMDAEPGLTSSFALFRAFFERRVNKNEPSRRFGL